MPVKVLHLHSYFIQQWYSAVYLFGMQKKVSKCVRNSKRIRDNSITFTKIGYLVQDVGRIRLIGACRLFCRIRSCFGEIFETFRSLLARDIR